MKAACMNAVRDPDPDAIWQRCGWAGEIESLDMPCPRCLNKGRLAPLIEIGPEDPT